MRDFAVIIAYLGSIFAICSYSVKTAIPIRIFGMLFNISMLTYSLMMTPILLPLFILHLILLPINALRYWQMKQLIKEIKSVSEGHPSMEWLVPYMKKESFHAGETLFKKGDISNKIFLIKSGTIEMPEIHHVAHPDDLLGEIGVMSPHSLRTASAICQTDVKAFTIEKSEFLVLYYQNPTFGFYLLQTIVGRLINNYEDLKMEHLSTNLPSSKNV